MSDKMPKMANHVSCASCGRPTFKMSPKATSTSRAWAVYYDGTFRGVYEWRGRGGLTKKTAQKFMDRRFPDKAVAVRAVSLVGYDHD